MGKKMDMILLNQSTNHLPLHDDVKRAMIEFSPSDVNTYGQATGSDELKNAVAEHYKINLNEYGILLTNGSFEAIHMILDTFSGTYSNFTDIIPSWSWPRSMAQWRGYHINEVKGKLKPQDIIQNSIVFLNNGQNPLGYTYTDEELYDLQWFAQDKHSMILHDTAYWDFFREPFPLLLNDKNFATFTFSKVAGLCGLRIGGLIASKENILKFKNNNPARLGVNVMSEKVALASLKSSHEWKIKNIEIIERNKQRVREELGVLDGVNFLHEDNIHKMVITFDKPIECTDFTERLGKEGINVLDISTKMFQMGVKEPDANMITFMVSIPDEWLDQFIEGFKKVYYEW
jgi:aspartate/methionine/tyrosine aminotransferase